MIRQLASRQRGLLQRLYIALTCDTRRTHGSFHASALSQIFEATAAQCESFLYMHATYGSLFYQIPARKARHPKIVSNEGLQWRPSLAHLRISGIFLPLCTAIYAVCQGWRLIMSCLSLVGSVPCAVSLASFGIKIKYARVLS